MTATAKRNFAGRLVERLGHRSYLIDAATGHTVAPEDLPRLIAAYAGSLVSAGLREGDRVLIGCSLSPLSALVYLGTIYAGLVAVPIEVRTMSTSIARLLEITGAKAVWTESGLAGVCSASALLLQGDIAKKIPSKVAAPAARKGSDLAVLMATSGSTGVPRFVMISHENLISNTEAIIRSQRLSSDERAMLILPLSYSFGASVLHTHLYQGGSVVFDRRFMFPDKVLQSVAQYECTTFAGVPTVYDVLLRRSRIQRIAMPSLRRFLQAGGALSSQKINEMRTCFPQIEFYVMYGQTEASPRISCMEPERWEKKPGSVGRPLDNLAVTIVDEAGDKLPAGQVGELLVKGPSICAGYWNDQEATNRNFVGGWLHTGDLARQDEDGYLWIEGRKGEFLKMRGMRVSFAEVEAKVNAVPGVYECAAAAVDHPEVGEALVLFIVLEHGATVGRDELRRHLPAHWTVDSVHLLAELPKTPTGKIARTLLPACP